MNESARIDVALFPIPNVVAFPGMTLPLHVFEPRYRKLVHDCVSTQRMVAVSHTQKVIHQPDLPQSLERALQSNQATYKPQSVFSAGYCRIIDTLEDGRIMAAVDMSVRVRLEAEIQSLPYRIVSCSVLQDDAGEDSLAHGRELQQLILEKLLALISEQNPDLTRELAGSAWRQMEPAAFSFRVFQLLQFDADIMQTLLETTSPSDRLSLTWDILRRA